MENILMDIILIASFLSIEKFMENKVAVTVFNSLME